VVAKFSLQSVLDVRHSRVEGLEIELSQLVQAENEALERLLVLERAQAELYATMRAARQGEVKLNELALTDRELLQLEKRLEQARGNRRRLHEQVDAKRSQLVQARQDEEVLETLKGKEIERQHAEEVQSENRAVDEIYVAQAFRQRHGEVP
jgi:flagellar export protein FliJ